jgi:ABC-type arginine transport system permease subunit
VVGGCDVIVIESVHVAVLLSFLVIVAVSVTVPLLAVCETVYVDVRGVPGVIDPDAGVNEPL